MDRGRDGADRDVDVRAARDLHPAGVQRAGEHLAGLDVDPQQALARAVPDGPLGEQVDVVRGRDRLEVGHVGTTVPPSTIERISPTAARRSSRGVRNRTALTETAPLGRVAEVRRAGTAMQTMPGSFSSSSTA